MRAIITAAAFLASAAPALAQVAPATPGLDRSVELQAQIDMERQRLNTLQNENFAAETRLRSEQTIRQLEAQRPPLHVTPLPPPSATPIKPGAGYAEIPDAALADSNARVRAAAGRR